MVKLSMRFCWVLLAVMLLMSINVGDAAEKGEEKEEEGIEDMNYRRLYVASPPSPSAAAADEELLKYCKVECDRRCSRSWKKKMCLRMCNICCGKCRCVPPGYAGNKEQCPCYRDLKNKKGQDKCP